MKKCWKRLVFLVAGVLSFLGIQPSWAALTPPTPQVGEIKENTPLYLKLGVDRVPMNEKGDTLAYWRHYQHWSHYAHRSHWAHYAHWAHYSHYNYYRPWW